MGIKRRKLRSALEEEDYDVDDEKPVAEAPVAKQPPAEQPRKSQVDKYLDSKAYTKKKGRKASSSSSEEAEFSGESDESEPSLDDEEEMDTTPRKSKRVIPSRSTRRSGQGIAVKEEVKVEAPKRTRATTRSQAPPPQQKMDVDEEEEPSSDSAKPLAGLKVVLSGEFESIARKKLEDLVA